LTIFLYLSVIFIKAELRLQHQREQNREARQLRHKELEKNARDVRKILVYLSYLVRFLSNKLYFYKKKDATGSDSELNKNDQKSQEEKEEISQEVIIPLQSRTIKYSNRLDRSHSFDC
jgi:hypothetical protein